MKEVWGYRAVVLIALGGQADGIARTVARA